jgi:hypothetical protein
MNKNYFQLIRNIQSRQNPEGLILEKSYRDELGSIAYSDVLVFIRSAMRRVEPAYTRRSKEAGEKVKEHLKTVLTDVTYKYQGSVMTDTHIKGYSDIDLLTICEKFYVWDNVGIPNAVQNNSERQKYSEPSLKKLQLAVDSYSPYNGDTLSDLFHIRLKSEAKLSDVYIDCDTDKPKAIRIINRNLNREVDIVTANWYDGILSIVNGKGDYRGIQVYNKNKHHQGNATYPFLSIQRINARSSVTNGRLKKMIRFLKHCKVEAGIDISSFEINAVCYDIDPNIYRMHSFYELVPVIYQQLKSICENDYHANNLVSVDGHERIFQGQQDQEEKRHHLKLMLQEVRNIILDMTEARLLAS